MIPNRIIHYLFYCPELIPFLGSFRACWYNTTLAQQYVCNRGLAVVETAWSYWTRIPMRHVEYNLMLDTTNTIVFDILINNVFWGTSLYFINAMYLHALHDNSNTPACIELHHITIATLCESKPNTILFINIFQDCIQPFGHDALLSETAWH